MRSERLRRVIASARVHGLDPLEEFIRRGVDTEAEVPHALEYAVAIIEGVPGLLSRVAEQAQIRGVGLLVEPLVEHAEQYFLDPIDHAPELAFGLPGLLDDAYLALRLVDVVQQAYRPLVPGDIAGQMRFLRRLLGPDLVAALDAEAGRAILELATSVAALRQRGESVSAPAQADGAGRAMPQARS